MKVRKRKTAPSRGVDTLTPIWEKLRRRYPGRYVAVVDGCVVSEGHDQLSVYRKAEKGIPVDKEIGIFYIPEKNARSLLL